MALKPVALSKLMGAPPPFATVCREPNGQWKRLHPKSRCLAVTVAMRSVALHDAALRRQVGLPCCERQRQALSLRSLTGVVCPFPLPGAPPSEVHSPPQP